MLCCYLQKLKKKPKLINQISNQNVAESTLKKHLSYLKKTPFF